MPCHHGNGNCCNRSVNKSTCSGSLQAKANSKDALLFQNGVRKRKIHQRRCKQELLVINRHGHYQSINGDMYSKRKRPVNNFNCIQMHLSRNNVLLLLQAFDAITLQRYTLYTSAKYSIEISINWAIWYCVLIFDINLIGHMVPFCVDGHI